jgi:Tfp pilus assembly protein PilF
MSLSPFKTQPRSLRTIPSPLFFVLLATLCLFPSPPARAQGGVESTGTGGVHVIQGRVFLPSGRISDASLRVKLESFGTGTLSVFTDLNGGFKFTSLMAGSYTVVVEGTEQFEPAREPVYIDQQTSRAARDSTPRVYTVFINLRPKHRESENAGHSPGVVNASLAGAPKPAADLYNKAMEEARKGETERAVEHLKNALTFYPDFQLALSELGVQYMKLKQPDKAIETLHAALKLAPDDYATLLTYGRALYDRQNFPEAEAQFRKAAKKNNSSPSAHFYLGMILLKRHELDGAEKELKSAIEFGGDHIAVAHYYLGGIYWGRQDKKRAADELETYLRLAPDAADAARVRATIKELRAKQ